MGENRSELPGRDLLIQESGFPTGRREPVADPEALIDRLDRASTPETPVRRRTRGIVIACLIGVGVLALLWTSIRAVGGIGLGSNPSGQPAPRFEAPVLGGGGNLALGDLKGKPVVLNFWASWCGPCRQEAPTLAAAEKRWRDRGVVFLGVNSEDTNDPALAFVQEFAIEYRSVVDPEGRIELEYGVTGFPETFFIDRSGVILAKYFGPIDATELESRLTQLIG